MTGTAAKLTPAFEARRGGGLIKASCVVIFAEDGGGDGGLVSSRGLLKVADSSRGGEQASG